MAGCWLRSSGPSGVEPRGARRKRAHRALTRRAAPLVCAVTDKELHMTTDISLAQGREYLAIPGPSVMPDAVLQAMHRASPNIYEGALVDMVAGMVPDLKRVARTE